MAWPNSDANHLIVTSSQMKDIEEKLFSDGLPVAALMEKVGLAMKAWLLSNHKTLKKGVLVLVGPGHNGGDGLVLARELYLAGVVVSLWCPFETKKQLTATHLSFCKSIGINILKEPPDPLDKALWIDALFGLGQSKPLPKEVAWIFHKRDELSPGNLISIDVPSGVCSDTGKSFLGGAAKASFTLTVGLTKSGLLQDQALPYVGKLVRVDIGLPRGVFDLFQRNIPLKISSDDLDSFPLPSIDLNATKYKRGRLLVIAGSEKYRGASLLALKGALASGVGSIEMVIPEKLANNIWPMVPEVVFRNCLKNPDDKKIFLKDSLAEIKFHQIDSLVIGPGLGIVQEEKWSDISAPLEEFQGLLVLDADALNRLSGASEGWRWLCKRNAPTWITPNINEFRRLFPEIKISSPLNAALTAAQVAGVGVLLKGAHSVVAAPDGSVWQLGKTSSYIARTGLGDVLAGFLGGLGAFGISSKKGLDYDLFAFGVLIHAYAGSLCNEGTNAALISNTLGKVLKELQDTQSNI